MVEQNKRKFLVTISITLTVLLALAVLSSWAVRFLKKNAAILIAARQEFAYSAERREVLQRERERRAALESAREELKTFFVNREDPLPFIEAVESLARASKVGIELSLVSPGGDRESGMSYAVGASGSYAVLLRFLKAFEELPYAVTIAHLNLTRSSPSPQLVLELSVKTFDARAAP